MILSNFSSAWSFVFPAFRTRSPCSDGATGGGILYAEGGALKYRGSNGTVTVIAPA
jgi:hypothetical protein